MQQVLIVDSFCCVLRCKSLNRFDIMKNHLCKLPDVRSVLLAVFKMIFICFLLTLLFIYTLDDGARRKFTTLFLLQEELVFINTSTTSSDYYESELPVCVGNLLDQREYRYVREAGESYDANRLMHSIINKGSACRLLHYTPQRLVSCFDHLHYFVHNKTEISGSAGDSKLHFVFLGDSRIRHQFYNFVRLIPDFGSQVWPIEIPPAFHGDIEITSDILRLGLSFQWRPLINETVIETIRQWATHENERPYFVFLGMAVHHMMEENGGNFKSYQENLMQLAPILGQLANVTRVVWLNQYPSVDSNAWINDINTVIFSEKIHSYNKAIRQILENKNIPIWDSSNPLGEEYVRACATLKRDEIFDSNGRPCLFKDVTYYDCDDYIHTGYSALSQATQLLFNDICNTHV